MKNLLNKKQQKTIMEYLQFATILDKKL